MKLASPLIFVSLFIAIPAIADPVAELAGFSVFEKIDVNQLAQGDVKTVHGPPMTGRFLSVETCYVMAGSPREQVDALRNWDPTKHRELKVFVHTDLPETPTPANFSKLKRAPDNSSVKAFVAATEKMSSDLQVSRDEAKKVSGEGSDGGTMPRSVVSFWSDVLAGRAKSFANGGTAAQPAYDHSEEAMQPNDELKSLLKNQDKIRKQFSGFLGETGIGRGPGSLTPELYWELLDVDDLGVVTLGAFYNRATANGAYQAADVLYYASGGYYVTLTLYQMWPVTANGKPSTLVWRGDMTSSAALASLHGVERLGSESAMVKDISKAITFFRKDMAR